MELKELKELIKENGIAGAGGAGFPTYGKIDERAKTIILNYYSGTLAEMARRGCQG